MASQSAGILAFRRARNNLEVFLVHPGGPFWAKKDAGAWSLPKGEYDNGEDPLAAARREFQEETGLAVAGDFVPLGTVKQPGGKIVVAWAIEADFDPRLVSSNTFSMEWPPRSGRQQEFPEVDKAAWFTLDEAREKLLKGQRVFLDRLASALIEAADTSRAQ
jgi:predicted NUDIX family NTP pyrophosphohydrolase